MDDARSCGCDATHGQASKLTSVWIGAGAVLLVLAHVFPLPDPAKTALCLAAYAAVGWGPIRVAVRNVFRGRVFDENFLMTVATAGALAIGEYPEAVAVMLFYQIGEAFQDAAVRRSRRAIRALVDLRADTANVWRDGEIVTTAAADVRVGETIIVRPGERIPLDGEVEEGFSSIDFSPLTGESIPRDVVVGNEVLAGGVNLSGVLRVRVTHGYGQSTVSRILELVQEAASHKARTEALITRFARIYTPTVIVFAVLVMAVGPFAAGGLQSTWLYRGLVFLVASCPCALVLSIPLSFFGGIGGASRGGVLVKGGNYLEALARLRTAVFDKTGTLTRGQFVIAAIRPEAPFDEDEVLTLAAHAELHSSHPLAKSVVAAYGTPDARRVEDIRETAGQGVTARVDGRDVRVGNRTLMRAGGIAVSEERPGEPKGLWVAVDGRIAGFLVVADTVKAVAAEALRDLRTLGVERIVVLTGDTPEAAQPVAAQVGADEVFAGLLPDGKVERVRAERARLGGDGLLAYVGDGINDAPVLASADVGIAMGALGSDAAIEAADVVVMDDDLTRIGAAVRQARATRRVVTQNIAFALGVKAAVLAGSVLGLAAMWGAVFADVGVALLATLNAARLIRRIR